MKSLFQQKEDLKKDILEIQLKESEQGFLSAEELWILKSKINELNSTLARLTTWWKQRAKIKWWKEGDCNSNFFHSYANARRNSNFINSIRGADGNMEEEPDRVEEVLMQFFKNKWQQRNCKLDGWLESNSYLDEEDRKWLNNDFTLLEVEKCYQIFRWFYCPRPISLCNTLYKIAAKVLFNRMAGIIPKLISREQAAFLSGRSLNDQVILAQEIFHKFRYSKSNKGLVSFKIDMEQAYDSMGWPALNKVLYYFRFPEKFCNLLMECVKNPKFSLLINGNRSPWIRAYSGFRQGCPLSPYLFILCSQLISSMFQINDSIGIQISPNGPKISHLLYADDIIIFSEAKLNMVKKIKGLVKKFCDWTGQKVNNEKSLILCGNSVKRRRKNEISKIMGFKLVKEFNYLGIKITLRRLKKSDFQFIIDKVLKMLSVWGSKFISLAGRIMLVKTVLLAYPTFYSTLSLIPKGLLYEIEKHCKNFIWNKNRGEYGIHYVNWNSLCDLVMYGGRGLKSCSKKIGPLRAKMAWKYNTDKDSLLYKFLFPKYGMLGDMKNGRKSTSSAWKIIKDGWKFLKPIVRWKISNGDSIDILQDTWIMDKSLNEWPTVLAMDDSMEGNRRVSSLISGDCWNLDELNKSFGKDLVEIIRNIKIHSCNSEDRLELINSCSRKTISAMAYAEICDDCDKDVYWSWIKEAKLNARVENFWWRLFKNAIPTFQLLSSRKLQSNVLCPRGCNEPENIEHVANRCKKLLEVFNCLNEWGFCIPVLDNMDYRCNWLKAQNTLLRKIYCNSVFITWKERNEGVHGKSEQTASFIASEAISLASVSSNLYLLSTGRLDVNQHMLLEKIWHPPPPGWIKINLDASLLRSNKGGTGGVIRDCKGRLLLAFGKPCIHWDIAHLELLSIEMIKDIIQDWMLEYKGVIIEGDNANIMKLIQDTLKKVAREEHVGGSLRRRLFYIRDLEGTLPSPRGKKIRRKPGHLRADCPNLKSQPTKEKSDDKAKYKKDKMKTQKAFWSDSASESSEEEVEEEVTNLCLMANDNLDQSDQDEGRTPNLSHLHVFGCKCFILNNGKHPLEKFDPKSDEGVFLGYSFVGKAYKIFNKRTLVVEESTHVVFDDSDKPSEYKIEDDEIEAIQGVEAMILGERVEPQEDLPREGRYRIALHRYRRSTG
ncbi:hypothetical protein KFK09_000528 [Dendrobium nobile]|uniref:Reverse transcriptase domain-containing protein n=1 Tax=Dendrobium nobile TaxID=94219 RepID=A0A8T3CE83_DENNO|nr:hypothetical protein KFK09_000528 [Dendrobium nobile]